MQPIQAIAEKAGILEDELELYGATRPRSTLACSTGSRTSPQGKNIDVTAITPTPLGEGKTVTTVGLSQALNAHRQEGDRRASASPRMGPVFGIKGGAAGGGYCAGRADGGLQPPPHRRHPRRRHRPTTCSRRCDRQRTSCTATSSTSTRTSITWRRVRGHQRPRAAQHHHRPRRQAQRHPARRPASTSPWPARSWRSSALATRPRGPARAPRPHRHRHEHAGKPVTAEDLGVAGAMTVLHARTPSSRT